jgi:hypothetical protein
MKLRIKICLILIALSGLGCAAGAAIEAPHMPPSQGNHPMVSGRSLHPQPNNRK